MSGKFIILGCGSSMGVPRPDGYWGKCNPNIKENFRTRCSSIITTKDFNILIDTSPDLRNQLIKQKIKNIDSVLYSHMHADQTHGINDLRVFFLKDQKKINVYADKQTSLYLKDNFSYCFKNEKYYPAMLNLKTLKKYLIFKKKKSLLKIKSIPVKHGSINCMSFIINNKIAYASDTNDIYKKDLKHFKNLKFLIIDCLRISKHPSHYNLAQILQLIEIIKPKKTILTNLHSDLDYNYLLKILPNNVIPAYDGMSLNI